MIIKTQNRRRFEALDAFRGLCALIVVLGHFCMFFRESDIFGSVIKNSYVFVDFFFVLSGFVISHAYLDKIKNLNTFKKFIYVRFFRVYPLHLFMLLLFVLLEVVKAATQHTALFLNPFKSLESLIANLLLVQSLGIYNYLTWNFPAWSISTEFYTYITFAIIVLLFKKQTIKIAVVFSIIFPLALIYFTGKKIFDFTYDYGFIRCIIGFYLGIIANQIYQFINLEQLIKNTNIVNFLEISFIGLVVVFATYTDISFITYASPLVFLAVVILFTYEAGIVSKLLKTKFFLTIGTLSYSMYMTHAFVQAVLFQITDKFSHKFNLGLTTYGQQENSFEMLRYYNFSDTYLILITLLMLLLVFLFSSFTYKYIEQPFYTWGKKICQ